MFQSFVSRLALYDIVRPTAELSQRRTPQQSAGLDSTNHGSITSNTCRQRFNNKVRPYLASPKVTARAQCSRTNSKGRMQICAYCRRGKYFFASRSNKSLNWSSCHPGLLHLNVKSDGLTQGDTWMAAKTRSPTLLSTLRDNQERILQYLR